MLSGDFLDRIPDMHQDVVSRSKFLLLQQIEVYFTLDTACLTDASKALDGLDFHGYGEAHRFILHTANAARQCCALPIHHSPCLYSKAYVITPIPISYMHAYLRVHLDEFTTPNHSIAANIRERRIPMRQMFTVLATTLLTTAARSHTPSEQTTLAESLSHQLFDPHHLLPTLVLVVATVVFYRRVRSRHAKQVSATRHTD